MKTWQKIVVGFGIALSMLGLLAAVTYHSTQTLLNTVQLVTHSRHVLERQESLGRHLIEAENDARAFLLTADEKYLAAYQEAQQGVLSSFEGLKQLTADNADQQRRLGALQPLFLQKKEILEAAVAARKKGELDQATKLLSDESDARIDAAIKTAMRDFEANERLLLDARSRRTNEIGLSTTFIILLASGASVLLLGGAAAAILRDVGARRRAEVALAEEHNLLRNVIDAMPAHVFVKDTKGRYIIDNKAHRSFVGVKTFAEVEGKTVRDFFPPEVARQFEDGDEKVSSCGEDFVHREEPIVDREGKLIWLSTTKVPLRDIHGKCMGLVGISSDISASKEDEEQLRLASEQLKRSNEELQEFASVASHDLQEPLRKIQAFGDRLRTKCGAAVGEEGRDYLERMQSAARRMQTLLHDLLMLSRVTSGAKPFVSVDLEEIARDVVGDLEVRIEQTGAKIEVGFLPKIEADPSQIRQLFQNLISNAMKFQAAGSTPQVIISAKIREVSEPQLPGAAPGEEVCQIMIQDNGIGFSEKYLDRIFTVFQRLHSRSEFEGTGIGLAVCRKILDRHGGVISAKSAEGEGATFIVTLPVKQRMKTASHDARKFDHDIDG